MVAIPATTTSTTTTEVHNVDFCDVRLPIGRCNENGQNNKYCTSHSQRLRNRHSGTKRKSVPVAPTATMTTTSTALPTGVSTATGTITSLSLSSAGYTPASLLERRRHQGEPLPVIHQRRQFSHTALLMTLQRPLAFIALSLLALTSTIVQTSASNVPDMYESTTPLQHQNQINNTIDRTSTATINATTWSTTSAGDRWRQARSHNEESGGDSIFLRFAQRFTGGNELWDGIVRDCYKRPTFSCFQKNVFTYLNDALEAHDVNITQRLKLYKNQVDYADVRPVTEAAAAQDVQEEDSDATVERNSIEDEHLSNNEIPHVESRAADNGDPITPIEEVTNALYGKSVKFAMTHDLELRLPEMLFDGATFRISPRAIEGNGLIAKLELIPKQEIEARLAGKIIMNKIKKFLRSKLLLSFLALVLIIKIIKIKLFWLLPIVIGVGAAKKLLLKFLLFLFPALSHLFKLCSYYQQTYHSTKYHHHHHLINHHHTIVPAWHAPDHHAVPEIIYTNPPKGHISTYLHGAAIHENHGPYSLEHSEGGWENSGPGLGSEYIADINRVAQIEDNSNYFKPHAVDDANEILVWGLGTTQPTIPQHKPQQQQQQQHQLLQQQLLQQQQQKSAFAAKLKIPAHAQSAPSPVYAPPPPQAAQHRQQLPEGNGLTAAHIAAQYDPSRNNNPAQQQQQQQQQLIQQLQQQQQLSPELAAQLKEALRIQAEQRIIAQQQKILDKQPFVQDGQPLMPKNYDPFYSPILLKIDKIIEQLGVSDELCKERLVCSMYKDPTRYSPHSNFVSAELSRDTSELQPITNTNPAVVRFYRFIQAARDGQDQRDCLRLYPQCNINTE